MKRIKAWLAGLVLLLAGCGLTATERQSIIDAATRQASETAYQTTYAKVRDELVKQGKSIEEAEALARGAADIAGRAAGAVAGRTAGATADALADQKRTKTSGWLAAMIPILLGIGGDLLKKLGSGGAGGAV